MQQPDSPECAGAAEGNSGAGRVFSPARRARPGGPDRARQGAGAACAARQRRRRTLRRPRRAGRRRAPCLSLRVNYQEMHYLCLPKQVGLRADLVYSALCQTRGIGRTPCLFLQARMPGKMCNHGAHKQTSLSFHAHLSHVARCGLCACGALCPLYCSMGLSNAALPCKAKQTPQYCKSHGC